MLYTNLALNKTSSCEKYDAIYLGPYDENNINFFADSNVKIAVQCRYDLQYSIDIPLQKLFQVFFKKEKFNLNYKSAENII